MSKYILLIEGFLKENEWTVRFRFLSTCVAQLDMDSFEITSGKKKIDIERVPNS